MRICSPTLAFVLALLAIFPCGCSKKPADGPRDIVVILLDAVRADHLSCYGYGRPTTPVIDGIAREGVLFERAYTAAPWTLASVASIFTGNMPETHGAGVWSEDRSKGAPTGLSEVNITLAEKLKEAGYKSYCRAANPYIDLGCRQGFDKSEAIPGSADEIVDWGLDMTREAGESPLFLYLHFMDAHTTRDLSREYINKFPTPEAGPREPRHQSFGPFIQQHFSGDELVKFSAHRVGVYDGAIHYMDQAIGKLMKGLEKRGRLDRTWFVILADHGEEFWDHAADEEHNYVDSRGYYGVGHGHSLFEELLRVPFIIKGPETKAGHRVKTPVSLISVAPTLLECIGLSPKLANFTLGRSLAESLTGKEPARAPIFSQQVLYGHKRRCVIDTDDWKYIYSFNPGEKNFMFQLKTDPLEKNNVIASNDERAKQLGEKMNIFFNALPKAANFDPSDMSPATAEMLRNIGYLGGAASNPK